MANCFVLSSRINDLKVFLLFVACFIAVIILINLSIGFATSSSRLNTKRSRRDCFCSRHSTTNCLIRFVFLINQLIFFLVLILLIIFCITSFVFFILTVLCTDENRTTEALLNNDKSFDLAQSNNNQGINLQPFGSLLMFNSNETHLLLFKDNRLKILCRDYVSTLTLYNLITLLGILLLYIGFHCYLINLTVNRIRISTYKKYTELLYLNGTEMNTFNDNSYDTGERF